MGLREKRAELRTIRKNACSEHPDGLLGMKDGLSWCNECEGSPVSLVRVSSETEKYLTGDNTQNAAIKSRLRDKFGEVKVTTNTALALREPTAIELRETGKQFADLVDGFGDAISDADLHLAAQLRTVGFIPQHFNIVHGGLYMNFTGWIFWTKNSLGAMDGGSDARPMTADEREAYKVNDDQVAFIATYYKVAGGQRFPIATDFGKAGGAGEQNPLAKTGGYAGEIAQKRALVRVMRQAAPLGVYIGTFDAEAGGVVDDTPMKAIVEPESTENTEVNPEEDPEGFVLEVVSAIKGLGELDIEKFNFEGANGRQGVARMTRSAEYDLDEIIDAVKMMCIVPAVKVEDGEQVEELPW